MTALAAADVTVSCTARNRDIVPAGPKQVNLVDISFGDDTLTYPTGGVPMPAIGNFGYKKAIEFCAIEQPANGYFYKYDRTNHKMMVYTQGVRTGSSVAADATSGALVEDSGAAETVVRFMGTAVDTNYDLGPMREIPSTQAQAAVTLRAMLVGE